jgi:hypothetical protein
MNQDEKHYLFNHQKENQYLLKKAREEQAERSSRFRKQL